MTQTPDAAPQTSNGKAMRWVLIGSLAVNLAVVGLVVGAYLHDGSGGRDMVRDMGFGPYDAALRPEDRDTLKSLLRGKSGALKATHGEAADDVRLVLAALRADPFDPAALEASFATQQDHLTARMKLGTQTIRDFLINLPAQDRLAFADRLEQRLLHGKMDGPDSPKN